MLTGCRQECTDLRRQLRDRGPLLGQHGLQGRVVPFPVSQRVAQAEHEGNEVIAGGMVQINHASILRLPCPLETPYP